MKTKKTSKKLKKLLALSQEGQPGICSALFNKNDVILNGFSNVAITPDTALFYIENDNQTPIFQAIIKGEIHSNHSLDQLEIVIDSRNNLNTQFHLNLNDTHAIFSSDLTFEAETRIILYFEYDNNSILVVGFTEPSTKRFIIECISSQNKSSMAFSRLLVQNTIEEEISERFRKFVHPLFKESSDLNEQ